MPPKVGSGFCKGMKIPVSCRSVSPYLHLRSRLPASLNPPALHTYSWVGVGRIIPGRVWVAGDGRIRVSGYFEGKVDFDFTGGMDFRGVSGGMGVFVGGF